jgi:hypothetical protein
MRVHAIAIKGRDRIDIEGLASALNNANTWEEAVRVLQARASWRFL